MSHDANAWIVQAFCPRGDVTRVRLDLGEREDTPRRSLVPVVADGGAGADTLETGIAADVLLGLEGNDRLTAGGGDDVLDGGLGVDALDAGPGGDDLRVRDGVGRHGPLRRGPDQVDADTLDDVAADCEAITATPTPPPAGASSGDDRTPPRVDAGAATLQHVGRRPRLRIAATTSERGTLAASGFLDVDGISLPLAASACAWRWPAAARCSRCGSRRGTCVSAAGPSRAAVAWSPACAWSAPTRRGTPPLAPRRGPAGAMSDVAPCTSRRIP